MGIIQFKVSHLKLKMNIVHEVKKCLFSMNNLLGERKEVYFQNLFVSRDILQAFEIPHSVKSRDVSRQKS